MPHDLCQYVGCHLLCSSFMIAATRIIVMSMHGRLGTYILVHLHSVCISAVAALDLLQST